MKSASHLSTDVQVAPAAATTSACCGCGVRLPIFDGPSHRYMAASSACWATFGRVLAKEYSDQAYATHHRLSVDAYAVQHPGIKSPQSIQSVAVHLCRLCVLLEHEFPIERANEVMLAVKKTEAQFRWLEPPQTKGELTVADVAEAKDALEHATMVRKWAESAWKAWSQHHEMIRSWLPLRLGLR